MGRRGPALRPIADEKAASSGERRIPTARTASPHPLAGARNTRLPSYPFRYHSDWRGEGHLGFHFSSQAASLAPCHMFSRLRFTAGL